MIRGHQMLILAGETGSGKTTQLPKIEVRVISKVDLLGTGGAANYCPNDDDHDSIQQGASRFASIGSQPIAFGTGYQILV